MSQFIWSLTNVNLTDIYIWDFNTGLIKQCKCLTSVQRVRRAAIACSSSLGNWKICKIRCDWETNVHIPNQRFACKMLFIYIMKYSIIESSCFTRQLFFYFLFLFQYLNVYFRWISSNIIFSRTIAINATILTWWKLQLKPGGVYSTCIKNNSSHDESNEITDSPLSPHKFK